MSNSTSFKDKLRKEVVNPAVKNSGTATLDAKILKVYMGSYTIELYDENGNKKILKGVKARIYGNDTPEAYNVGEKVQVYFSSSTKTYEITSKIVEDYDNYKSKFELKNDIYSSTTSDVMLGFIF